LPWRNRPLSICRLAKRRAVIISTANAGAAQAVAGGGSIRHLAESPNVGTSVVILAKAGIQLSEFVTVVLDPRLRGGDG
jgi:hypothetical protein